MDFKFSWLIVKVAEYSLIAIGCGSLTLTGVLIKDSNLTRTKYLLRHYN